MTNLIGVTKPEPSLLTNIGAVLALLAALLVSTPALAPRANG